MAIRKIIRNSMFVISSAAFIFFAGCTDGSDDSNNELVQEQNNEKENDDDSEKENNNSDLNENNSDEKKDEHDKEEEDNSDKNNDNQDSSSTWLSEKGYSLKWSDEFNLCDDDGTPLSSNWGYDVGIGYSINTDGTYTNNGYWGNGEEQWYADNRSENTYVSDGTLKIKAIRESYEGQNWTSARIVTRNLNEFKYGYIEMKAKIPNDKGVWPAFWMLRNDIYDEGGIGWPKGGEIDIMESSECVWDMPANLKDDKSYVYGTLHCEAGSGGSPIFTKGTVLNNIQSEWHTYAVEWTEKEISWYYDNECAFTYTPADYNNARWPFDEDFYIIINLAVGGNLGGSVPASLKESTMEIDYVRVYQKDSSSDNSSLEQDNSKTENNNTNQNTVYKYDWSDISYAGDGAGNGLYSNHYKFYAADGNGELINIQFPGFATEAGLYVTFDSAVQTSSLSSEKFDLQGAGIILHLSAFISGENLFTVTTATGTYNCAVLYE